MEAKWGSGIGRCLLCVALVQVLALLVRSSGAEPNDVVPFEASRILRVERKSRVRRYTTVHRIEIGNRISSVPLQWWHHLKNKKPASPGRMDMGEDNTPLHRWQVWYQNRDGCCGLPIRCMAPIYFVLWVYPWWRERDGKYLSIRRLESHRTGFSLA